MVTFGSEKRCFVQTIWIKSGVIAMELEVESIVLFLEIIYLKYLAS